jgi:hypothetical protein
VLFLLVGLVLPVERTGGAAPGESHLTGGTERREAFSNLCTPFPPALVSEERCGTVPTAQAYLAIPQRGIAEERGEVVADAGAQVQALGGRRDCVAHALADYLLNWY